jgi:hypothetical protein
MTDPPKNGKVGEKFNHPDHGTLTYNGNYWLDGSGQAILNEVVVTGKFQMPKVEANTAAIYASMTLAMQRVAYAETYLILNDLTFIGVADDPFIPIVAAAGFATVIYYGSQLPPAVKPTFSEATATTGVISCIAGSAAYSPERPQLAPNLNDLMATTAVMQEAIHQMGKGYQGQWDDELSPLTDAELLALLREAIAAGDNKLKQRIIKEQKRRGTRNKDKNRGRGDIK